MYLHEALGSFLVAKRTTTRERTRVWYRNQIRRFIEWVGEEVRVGEVEPEQIDRFLAEEADRVSPNTVSARYRALSALFNWLVERERRRGATVAGYEPALRSSPLEVVARPVVPDKEPRRAFLQDVARLVEAIPDDDWRGIRDRLLVRLLFWTGLRLAECAALRVEHVLLQERLLYVADGKGGKSRHVPFSGEMERHLAEYLLCRQLEAGVPPVGPLWPSTWRAGHVRRYEDGSVKALTPAGVAQMIRRRCRAGGIDPAINPHAFRHGAAMSLLNEGGMELEIVSKILGHSSPEVTRQIYADHVTASVQRAYDRAVDQMGK